MMYIVSISKGLPGRGHPRDEPALVSAAVGRPQRDAVTSCDHVVDLGPHIRNRFEEDVVRVDGTLLVRRRTGKNLVLDEVIGEPLLGMLEVLLVEYLFRKPGDGLDILIRSRHGASLI
jgi:hypothetical protein